MVQRPFSIVKSPRRFVEGCCSPPVLLHQQRLAAVPGLEAGAAQAEGEAGPGQAERAEAGAELEPGGQGQQREVTTRGDTAGEEKSFYVRFICIQGPSKLSMFLNLV